MKYANIKTCDIANGPGVRTSLFVSGCTHRCEGCFNAVAWDFNYGEEFTPQVIDQIIEDCKPAYVAGLTLLGGEPMEPVNQRGVNILVKKFKETYPDKNVWCYSGYTYDQDFVKGGKAYCEVTDDLLSHIDVLVDGEFMQSLYDISLRFRGSSNQRLIDLKKTKEAGHIVTWEDDAIMNSHEWKR